MGKGRIVFMGTPAFATASLKALYDTGYEVVGVVTVPDRPAGRGQKLHISDVKQFAVEHGLHVLQPEKLKNPAFVEELRKLDADIFVVVAFRMLPREVWSIPKKGTFNLHGSLLPQYRGAAPINHAVMNGEKKSGVTTFLIDEAIDTGNIILRKEENISETDTAGSLHDRLMEIGAKTVVETVDMLLDGKAQITPQNRLIRENEELKVAPKIFRENTKINPQEEALHIYNKVRGLSPYPGSYLLMDFGDGKTEEIKIFETSIKTGETSDFGKVHTDGKTYLCFETQKNLLEIKSLQSPGKKRLGIEEWLRGMKSTSGDWRVL